MVCIARGGKVNIVHLPYLVSVYLDSTYKDESSATCESVAIRHPSRKHSCQVTENEKYITIHKDIRTTSHSRGVYKRYTSELLQKCVQLTSQGQFSSGIVINHKKQLLILPDCFQNF